jgi:manganese-transporting P-type ATPase
LQAVEVLSKERPQPNIFNTYIILSVLGQATVHMLSLIFIHREAMIFVEILQEDLPVDGKFI